MAHVSLHDSQRVLFAVVPDKGPVSIRLTRSSPTALYDAIKEVRQEVEALRPGRPQHPVLLDVAPTDEPLPNAAAFNVLVKAFAMADFMVAGVLKSPRAEDLSEVSDLLVQDGAVNATAADLELFQVDVEEKIRLAKEAQAWAEALVLDAAFNERRHFNESAQVWEAAHTDALLFDWEAALKEDRVFNARQEATAWREALVQDATFNVERHARESALAWEEAHADNTAFEVQCHLNESAAVWEAAQQANAQFDAERRKFLASWEEALADNEAFDRRVFNAQWEEALAHNALVDRANRLADQTRQAVLTSSPLPVDVQALILGSGQVEVVVDDVELSPAAPVSAEQEDDEPYGDVVTAPCVEAPVATSTGVRPTRIFDRRLRSGLQEYAEGCDLTITGCVSSGAEAIADGNINVWNQVHGRLIAGAKGDTSARILCQAFSGEMVCIAGVYSMFENVPEQIRDKPVMFWLEDGAIHYRRIEMPTLQA